MIDIHVYGLGLSVWLFCAGVVMVITRRNIILLLLGIELMLNAGNLNFVIFSNGAPDEAGQIFGVFVVVIAAAEIAVALAIFLNIHKHYKSSDIDQLNEMKH